MVKTFWTMIRLRACLCAAVMVVALTMSIGTSAHAADLAEKKRKVIIDQDAFGPAGSNLQAILMLLQASDVEVLGITVTSGDGWRDENVSHTLRLLEIAQRTDVPVYAGAMMPLVNTAERTKRWEQLYGKVFYKGAWTEVWPKQGELQRAPYHAADVVPASPAGMPKIKAAAGNAADFMIRMVKRYPGEVTILAAGPLTNLALAARLDPQFASLAKELVFMGGSFHPAVADNEFAAEYVNTPRREFNMRWDPEAATMVLHEPWRKITQVPIDPTTKTYFKKEFFAEIAAGRAPFAQYLSTYGQSYPMWDELAVAVWLNPAIVTHSPTLLVDVDTSFTASYGDTLSWSLDEGPGLGERPVLVVQDVDVPAFERMTLKLLTQPTPARK